jgi:hypothetical protein
MPFSRASTAAFDENGECKVSSMPWTPHQSKIYAESSSAAARIIFFATKTADTPGIQHRLIRKGTDCGIQRNGVKDT